MATLVTEISAGAAAVVDAMGDTITTAIANPTILALCGLAIGYGVVKYVLGLIPMVRG